MTLRSLHTHCRIMPSSQREYCLVLNCNLWMMMSLSNGQYLSRRWTEIGSQQFMYQLKQLIFLSRSIPFRFPSIQPSIARYG